jgi:acetyl esterase/lipase
MKIFLVLIAFSPLINARDIHVGKDAASIHAAIKAAQPGDTIHLEPKIYRDYAGFYGKKGELGKPITLDGHGATLEGSDPIDVTKWSEISPGLFKNEALLPRLDDAITGRWFFLFNSKMQLMNRTSKGKSAPYKKPEELQPNEWTFIKGPPRADAKPQQTFGIFYIKLPPNQKLAEANIFMPVRSAGVQFSGDNAHLVIKNLTATHPYNDGFNIHGDCRDCVFENIRAIECGDDGISAHESAQFRVDGFVSIGNSTGICDTGTAQTSYKNIFLARNVAFDLYFLDDGRYSITNALVLSSAQNPFTTTGRAKGDCRLALDNVLLRRLVEPRMGTIAMNSSVTGKRCTFENLDFKVTGSASWENCLINGKQLPDAKAQGADVQGLQKLMSHADATPASLVAVAYGPHFRQTMDVWLAKSSKPTPVVFYIHGGGWGAQDKTDIHQHLDVRAFLDADIAVASINYRFLADANAAKITPPLQWPLQDAARALQYLRSHAAEWNLDKTRIAASGVSAGGCSSLWLAMHEDMADAKSADPISRESTRVLFTATKAPQPSLDPKQLVEWIPNSEYGGHAFGYVGKTRKETFAPFLANRDKHINDLRRYSPMSHASADDPPAFILCTKDDKPLVKGEAQKDPTHSAVLGLMLQDTLKPLGVKCEVRHPLDGKPETTMQEILLQHFKTEQP